MSCWMLACSCSLSLTSSDLSCVSSFTAGCSWSFRRDGVECPPDHSLHEAAGAALASPLRFWRASAAPLMWDLTGT
jgi:hypothetical protein